METVKPDTTNQAKPASMTVGVQRMGRGHMPTPPRPRKLPMVIVLVAAVSAGFGFLGGKLGVNSSVNNLNQTEVQQQVVSSQSQLISGIAKDVGPSVVSIDVTGQATQTDLFGFGSSYEQQSAGTGFIISSDGIVVTNRHVVPDGSSAISITLSDGTKLDDVSFIGATNANDPLDIAFLKINNKKGKTLKAVKLGNSSKVQVGEIVVAIGNALGQFQNTVTQGIISGHGRSLEAGDGQAQGNSESLEDLFQTDAAINAGNSGGPLVNASGQVIGINTAIAGNAQNVGFAIPINDVYGLISGVLKEGKLQRPFLGVRYVSLTPDVVSELNLKVNSGVYITAGPDGEPAIVEGSPADKAGLEDKDIITKVGNDAINPTNGLTALLGRYKVGDKVTLTVIRNDKTITVQATLGAAPTN